MVRDSFPVLILSFWWILWPILSFFNTMLDKPSYLMVLIVFVFVFAMLAGAGICNRYVSINCSVSIPSFNAFILLFITISSILLAMQLPVLLSLFYSFVEGESLAAIRRSLFVEGEFNVIERLIFSLSSSVFYNYLVVSSLVAMLFYRSRFIYVASFFVIVLTSFLKGSRAELYQFFCISLLLLLLVHRSAFFSYLLSNKLLSLFACVFVLGFLYLVGILRGDDLIDQLINYHTIGFVLFSKLIHSDIGNLIFPNFGISFFSGLDYLTGLLLRVLFFPDFQVVSKSILSFKDLSQAVGTYSTTLDGFDIFRLHSSNAFYTLLSSGYLAFGIFGVFFLGVFLGFVLTLTFRGLMSGSFISSHYFILLFSNVFMGIFSSFLETISFWLVMMLFNVIFVFFNRLSR